jgi:mono/diheme cytochrome c family protein
MNTLLVRMLLAGASLFGTTAIAVAQQASSPAQSNQVDFGKAEFESRCATCHGITGKGDGPTAQYLTRKPSDLTTLAKNNNGVLPVAAMYEVIEGGKEVPGHGNSGMPAWGNAYRNQAGEHAFDTPYDVGAFARSEAYARARILALIEYINRLQVK